MTAPSVEDLEKLIENPVEPDRSTHLLVTPEEKSEEEWIENCTVLLGSWQDEDPDRCGQPAEVNLILLCPFDGPRPKKGFCSDHAARALAGKLLCVECSRKARTSINLRPLQAFWKE